MNYFSHYAIDHIQDNHDFNTGLLLPDITKKKIRTFKLTENSQIVPNHFQQLHLGCLQHYLSDKIFHSSDFFQKHADLLNYKLKNSGLSNFAERKWFISHVMLELLIDRVIIKEHIYLLDDFYHSLNKVDENNLRQFLHYFGMENSDEFFVFFNHFRSVQYIYHYTDNKKFMYSLNRIMLRAGLNELNIIDNNILEGVLVDFEQTYFNNSNELLNNLKSIFN